jgi:hypothetical protein
MQTIRTALNLQTITPSMTLAITAKSKQLKSEGKDVIGFGAVSLISIRLSLLSRPA